VEFVWDASNIEHLGRHKITPQEAEEAILLDSLEPDLQRHSDEDRVLCFGRTAKGRLLYNDHLYRARRRCPGGHRLSNDQAAAAHLFPGEIIHAQ
jgi:uncharacterized DUF497 family protein